MHWKKKTAKKKYHRFQTGLRAMGTSSLLGVFSAVGELEEAGVLDAWSEQCLRTACAWFNGHLPVPALKPEHHRALFWFRESCTDMIQRLWDVVYVLKNQGLHVELIHTSDPGHFCYSDFYQIAAVPRRRRQRR